MTPRASLAIVVLALAALAPRVAVAGTFGVVIDGDGEVATATRAHVEAWATAHGEKVVAAPLSVDATTTLANCILIADRKCAAGVVDARGKADSIVFAKVEAAAVTLYWFRKQHATASEKLPCAPCAEELVGAVLARLADKSALATASVKLVSKPEGLQATLDGAPVGATPVVLDVPVGAHEVALVDATGTRTLARRELRAEAGQELELMLRAGGPLASEGPRWQLYLLGGGAAIAVTGGVLIATSEEPTGMHPTYRNTRPLGVTLAIGGAVIALAGGYLWNTRGPDSGPAIAPAPGGGAVAGWVGTW